MLPQPWQGLELAEVVLLTQQHVLEALVERNGSSKGVIINCTAFLLAQIGCQAPQARLKLEESGERHMC